MKQVLFLAIVLLSMTACGNKKTNQQKELSTASAQVTANVNITAYPLDSLLSVADQLIDKKVKVRGYITHTCKHSGKRCFIVGESQKTSFRVEAGGEIGGFNRELTGSEVEICGVVKERRLTQEYIAQHEKEVEEKKAKEDGSAESCQAELSNIKEMRDWMKANQKDYYSIYYMIGESYEVVEK